MDKQDETNWREITLEGLELSENSQYLSNQVNSSRYTWLNLIPKSLFEQFQRSANIWFLIVSIFQLVPVEKTTAAALSTILPLIILISITLLKDGYNTYQFLKKDNAVNNSSYIYWNSYTFAEIKCKDIKVGHILKIREKEKSPADVIILLTSSGENTVFVDNSQITGETNLITKKALTEIQMFCNTSDIETIIKKLVGLVKFEQPNNDFTSFSGKMNINKYPKTVEITAENMLNRGSTFHGAEWVLALVLYTGLETKTCLNLKKPKKKISRMEKKVNQWVLYILGLLTILVIYSSFSSTFLSKNNQDSFIENVILTTILYNNIVPISLFVVIDIVRVLQAFLTNYKFKTEILFNSSDVNENLGQVEYILADKSGTVSSNKLKLHSFMIDFCVYEKDTALDAILTEMEEESMNHKSLNSSTFGLKLAILKSRESPLFSHFIKCIIINNTVTPVNSVFLGVSSDEIALVHFLYKQDIKLIARTSSDCRVNWKGHDIDFKVLAQQGFSKENKISRTLITENSQGIYYIKSSLDMIEDLLDISDDDRHLLNDTINHMRGNGLRTMVLAYKKIPPNELADFEKKLESARSFPVDCDSRVNELFPLLESDLKLLGATGIEDEVSKETRESIESLKEIGIKYWLLSEDGEENTLLTAFKSKIISKEANVFRINKLKNQYHCTKILKRALDHLIFHSEDESISNIIRYLTRKSTIMKTDENFKDYNNLTENISLGVSELGISNNPLFSKMSNPEAAEVPRMLERKFTPENLHYAISIDGKSLRTALENIETRRMLVCLLVCSEAVSFHSLMPHDKADIARLLKENVDFSPIVLAVGDGDADIPMMQIADVAVNINSDLSEAKNFCEVSIPSFSVLKTLILDVGYWNYVRLAKVVLLFLYKNFVITVAIFCYFIIADYSAVLIFSDNLLIGFNLFSTTLPLICMGIFDWQFLSIGEKKDQYGKSLKNLMFNTNRLLEYSLLAVIHGLMIVSFCIGFNQLFLVNFSGATENRELLGTINYINIVLVVLIETLLRTFDYSWLVLISHLFSVVTLIVHLTVISSINSFDVYKITYEIQNSSYFILIICTLPLLLSCSVWLTRQSIQIFLPSKARFSRLEKYSKNLNSIFRETQKSLPIKSGELYEFYKYSLEFCSEYVEKVYKQIYVNQNIKLLRLTIAILWLLLIIWTILELSLSQKSAPYVIVRVLLSTGFTVIMAVTATNHFINHYAAYVVLSILLSLSLMFATAIGFARIGALSTGIVPSITYVLFNVNWVKISFLNILNQVLFIISAVYMLYASSSKASDSVLQILGFIILNIAIAATSAIVGHNLEKNNRLEYKLIKTKELGVEKTQRILSFLLPSFVKKRVKDGARYIADDQGVVTVLFCDIVNFENILAEYTPQEMTCFLDSVFQRFDSICSANGVTKIETVGKTYMACAGLKDSEDEIDSDLKSISHAQRVLSLALNIVHEASKFKLKDMKSLQVKIGINTGPVTAGVVGYHKPQFSLVGDTVNTASRMCSTLEITNKIQISKLTYDLLSEHRGIYFTSNVIEAKGKGKMHTYIVNEGLRGRTEEAWLDISHLSCPLPGSTTTHTIDRGESIKRHKKSILSSITQKDFNDYENTDGIKAKFFDLHCKESEKLAEFRQELLVQNKFMISSGLLIACISYSILLVFMLVYFVKYDLTVESFIVSTLSVSFLWTTFALFNKIHLSVAYQVLFLICILTMTIQSLLLLLSEVFLEDFNAIQIMYICLILDHTSGISLIRMIIFSFFIFTSWVIMSALYSDSYNYITNIGIILGFMVINIAAVYKRENQLRSYFNLRKLAEQEIEKTENLLTQMMPPHVLENMKKGKSVTDKFSNVTLLYADIVGFTYWSSDKNPEQVVGMLSELFTYFDKICIEHKVYKVHTIGDCYVVMGLIDAKKRDYGQECLNVINMALSMIKAIQEINSKRFSNLNMRIGIHTGEVIGGVIGSNIVRYDIYGPDVLIANKMESGGEAGKINVSDLTRCLIEGRFPGCFNFTLNKHLELKGSKTVYRSYFLSPRLF